MYNIDSTLLWEINNGDDDDGKDSLSLSYLARLGRGRAGSHRSLCKEGEKGLFYMDGIKIGERSR